jgi:transposase-like protein
MPLGLYRLGIFSSSPEFIPIRFDWQKTLNRLLALGILRDGTRDILGIWIEQTGGAKFWMKVFNDLQTPGVNDILIAVTDGLTGMPKALSAVFPATTRQTCLLH